MKISWGKRLISLAVAGAMALSVPLGVLADTYDLSKGDITVTVEKNSDSGEDDVWVMQKDEYGKEYLSEEADTSGNNQQQTLDEATKTPEEGTGTTATTPTITVVNSESKSDEEKDADEKTKEKEAIEESKKENSTTRVYDKLKGLLQKKKVTIKQEESKTTDNTISIKAEEKAKAEVVLDDVNIDVSEEEKAAITVVTDPDATVTLELDGDNVVKSGDNHAGVEKIDTNTSNRGTLVIQDDDDDDEPASLTAYGGEYGAGIGGGYNSLADDISILSGKITAIAGKHADGIGNGKGQPDQYGNEYYGSVLNDDAADAKNIVIADKAEVFAVGSSKGSSGSECHNAISCYYNDRTSNIRSVVEIKEFYVKGQEFAVLNAKTGEIVRRFTLPEEYTYTNFYKDENSHINHIDIAFDLPEEGTYIIVNTDGKSNNAILGINMYRNNNEDRYIYSFEESNTNKTYNVKLPDDETINFQFVSDTGADLPQEVLDQEPQEYKAGWNNDGTIRSFDEIYGGNFDPVPVEGGRWEFQHWTLYEPEQTEEETVNAVVRKVRGPFRIPDSSPRLNITMYGIWAFVPEETPVEPAELANTAAVTEPQESEERWYWVTALFNEDENVGYTYEMDGSDLIINTDEQAYGAVLHVLLSGWAEHTEVQSITFVTAGKTTTLYASEMLGITTGEQLTLTHEYDKATLAVEGRDYTYLLGEAAA